MATTYSTPAASRSSKIEQGDYGAIEEVRKENSCGIVSSLNANASS
ncbi:MAG TPA: hypothetical protein VFT39_02235 [Vicinamibacterales bacterium]|nr:hypothetical protein [Vicinamibacterales bacterium]